jgi:hypothetical protein
VSATATESQREELGIFVERFMHFMNLWTIYRDLLSKHYVPSLGPELTEANVSTFDKKEFPVGITMMLVLYAYFYMRTLSTQILCLTHRMKSLAT